MLHLPTPMLMGAPQGKSYADFVAWANAQTANTALPSQSVSSKGEDLTVLVTLSGFSGSMRGSPWGGSPSFGAFSTNSVIRRVAQHAFASEAHADMNASRLVLVRWGLFFLDTSLFGRDRNGYASLTYPFVEPAEYPAAQCLGFDYFNDDTGRRVHTNPFLQTVDEFDL